MHRDPASILQHAAGLAAALITATEGLAAQTRDASRSKKRSVKRSLKHGIKQWMPSSTTLMHIARRTLEVADADPLSITLSVLGTADFSNAARVSRRWAAASRRKQAWFQPSMEQLADFSLQPSRFVRRGVAWRSSCALRSLDDVLDSPIRDSVNAVQLMLDGVSISQGAHLLLQASQLPSLTSLRISTRQPPDALFDRALQEHGGCGFAPLQALRIDSPLYPAHGVSSAG
jgi:hypothetical protein